MYSELRGLSLDDKIVKCIEWGMTYRQIKLACGNPSTKKIKEVMKWADPTMYQMLNETESLRKYRDILWNK